MSPTAQMLRRLGFFASKRSFSLRARLLLEELEVRNAPGNLGGGGFALDPSTTTNVLPSSRQTANPQAREGVAGEGNYLESAVGLGEVSHLSLMDWFAAESAGNASSTAGSESTLASRPISGPTLPGLDQADQVWSTGLDPVLVSMMTASSANLGSASGTLSDQQTGLLGPTVSGSFDPATAFGNISGGRLSGAGTDDQDSLAELANRESGETLAPVNGDGLQPQRQISADTLRTGEETSNGPQNQRIPPPPEGAGAVGDTVWLDSNADGMRNDSEQGMGGVVVALYHATNGFVDSMTTGSDGSYQFAEVAVGDYYLVFSAPSGYNFTSQDYGGDAQDSDADASGQTGIFTVVDGVVDDTRDAGLVDYGGATVWIEASDPLAAEDGSHGGEFTVYRSGDLSTELTVSYSTWGTAFAGYDFADLGGSVTIAAYSASATIGVTAFDDLEAEGDESVIATLTAAAGYTIIAPESAVVFIQDDEVANQAPEFDSPNNPDTYTFNVAENSANATVVGTAGATDPDNDRLTYSITGGNQAGVFAIDANTGQITVANSALLDHETRPQVVLTVEVSDGALTDTATVTINITNVNEAPEFNDPDNPDVYTVLLGYSHKPGKDIKDTSGQIVALATDPEGAALTYSITAGDTDKFQIDATKGKVTLKVDAVTLPNENYTLTIQVSDGTLTDTATVNITLKQAVGVAGDTHAVEGSPDDIVVRLVRYAKDPNAGPLTATYTIGWDSAAADDLENSADKTSFLTRTVTFAAGETEKSFTLSAGADANREGIETFTVQVDAGAADYVPVSGSTDVKDKKKESLSSYSWLTFYVLDGVTLFGKQNLAGSAVDDVNGDGATNNADLTHANPGIHINDVAQGGLGDCYLMAALGALALENWGQIQSRFTVVDASTYKVSLWNGTAWQDFTVSVSLDRGFNAAQLSGDVDADGKAEIWTYLLEKAYAQMKGGYNAIGNGGYASDVYTALTGTTRNPVVHTAGKTDVQIWTEINNLRGQGKQVVVNTKATQPEGSNLAGNHAYVITGVHVVDTNGDGTPDRYYYSLYNPWGGTNANTTIEMDKLDDYLTSYDVLDNVP